MKRFNVLLLIATFSMNASWAANNLEDSRDEGLYKKARSHLGLGIYYSQQMKFTDAIAEYTKALKIQEFVGEKRALCLRNLANAYHNLGDIYARKKNFTAAITQYTTALAIEEFVGKERALCHYILGKIYDSKNNLKDAIIHYNAALAIEQFVGKKKTLCLTKLINANDRKNDSVLYIKTITPFAWINKKNEVNRKILEDYSNELIVEDVWYGAADRKNDSVLLGTDNFTPFDCTDEKNGRRMVRSCR